MDSTELETNQAASRAEPKRRTRLPRFRPRLADSIESSEPPSVLPAVTVLKASAADLLSKPRTRLASRFVRSMAWLAALVLVAGFWALPWLRQNLVWAGWLGLALGLVISARFKSRWGACWMVAAAALSIAIAFHWAPAVLAYTMVSDYWLGVVVFIPMVFWEALRGGLPIWLAGRVSRRAADGWLVAAAAALILEAVVPSVFPWRWGYFQAAWPWTYQAVDLFGPGWSTVTVFAHAGLLLLLAECAWTAWHGTSRTSWFRRLGTAPVLWLCLANLGYSAWAMQHWNQLSDGAPRLRAALVQVDPMYQGCHDKMRALADQHVEQVDLVCWPESSGCGYDTQLTELNDRARVFEHSREPSRGLRPWPNAGCALLLGAKSYTGDRKEPDSLQQTALLLDPQERIVGRYHKRHLMPFGEYVPGQWIPGINSLFSVQDEILAGAEANVLQSGAGARLGVMLCYEDMVPEAARSLAYNSANVLVSLINGSAFSSPVTLQQHRLLAQMRAVENRRYFLRCGATGETCVISPTGYVLDRLPLQTEGALPVNAALLDTRTCYTRYGDATSWGLAAALVAAVYIRRRNSTSDA